MLLGVLHVGHDRPRRVRRPGVNGIGAGRARRRLVHRGCHRDELVERCSPTVVESHLGMAFAGVDVAVHRQRRVLRASPGRLEGDDRSEGEFR